MKGYTLNDLKWTSVLEYKCVGTGKFFKTSNGRTKEETVGKDIVHTAGAGVIDLEEWYLLMEDAVKNEDKSELLDRIVEYCKSLAWLHTNKAVRQYALQCLSSEAYMAWKDFKTEEKT